MSSLEKGIFPENTSDISQEYQVASPKLELHPSLATAPYIMEFDTSRFGALLADVHGMEPEKVQNITVSLQRRSLSSRNSIGLAKANSHNVIFYGDYLWDDFYQNYAQAQSLAAGQTIPEKAHFYGLRTQKLAKYLSGVPRERGMEFSRKLILKAFQRDLDNTVFHESQHLADKWPDLRDALFYYPGEMLFKSRYFYLNSVSERKARRFAQQMQGDTEWSGILKLQIRPFRGYGSIPHNFDFE